MFTRTLLSFAFAAVLLSAAPTANAQSADVSAMLARMQVIMSEMTKLQEEFKSLSAQLQSSTAAPTPTVLGAQTSVGSSCENDYLEGIEFGATNDNIKRLQRLLATDPEIYPYGVASGYFGSKTEEALMNLQERFGHNRAGVVGPATSDLLSGWYCAYPDENYPDGVLSTKAPTVLGVSTSGGSTNQLAALQAQLSTLTSNSSGGTASNATNPFASITAEFDRGETWIAIKFNDGRKAMQFVADSDDEDEVVDYILSRVTGTTAAQVEAVIDYDEREIRRSSKNDADEGDAEDALDAADDAIDDARDEIKEADEDGDDIDWADETYDEARDLYKDAEDAFEKEDWDEAVDLAEEAEELAEEAIDRIGKKEKKGGGDVDEIIAYVGDDEAEIEVEFEDGDDDSFTVNTEEEDEIIEEVADELGIDEDEVEDIIEFRGKKVESIEVEIDDDDSFVSIEFEDGSEKNYSIDETDEDEIIETLSKRLKLTEKEVKRAIKFDQEDLIS